MLSFWTSRSWRQRLKFAVLAILPCALLLWARSVRSWYPREVGPMGAGLPHFSPSGSLVFGTFGSTFPSSGCQLWDWNTRTLISTLPEGGAFSPDETLIACFEGQKLVVRETRTGTLKVSILWPTETIVTHTYPSYFVDEILGWMPNGKEIATQNSNREICVYSARTGKKLRSLKLSQFYDMKLHPLANRPKDGWFREVGDASFSPDKRGLQVSIERQNWKNGICSDDPAQPFQKFASRNENWNCDWNGHFSHPVTIEPHRIMILGGASGNATDDMTSREQHPSGNSVTPQWEAVTIQFPTQALIELSEMQPARLRHTLNLPGEVSNCLFSPDATQLVVALGLPEDPSPLLQPEVRIYDVATGQLTRTIIPNFSVGTRNIRVNLSPDGSILFVASEMAVVSSVWQNPPPSRLQLWRLR